MEIAREQTVEIPEGVAAAPVEARTLGVVVRIGKSGTTRSRVASVAIDYPWRELVSDLPQLLNLLYGNISLQRGIRLRAVDWPADLVERFGGPRCGISGLRDLVGVRDRPLLATAIKPVGSSVRELARLAADCALGGIDLIKDDHSLADQPAAPFTERVTTVAEHVARANRQTGRSALYVPNLTGPIDRMMERLEDLRAAGIRAAMVAPMILGLDVVRMLAESSGVALFAHPALAGALCAARNGFAPALLFGDLFRLAGCDAVIYPNAGGRFPWKIADCLAVQSRLVAPMGRVRSAFAMVGGGIDADRLARWLPDYSRDTIFLVGGSLFAKPDLRSAAAELAKIVSRTSAMQERAGKKVPSR
ncbi:MAG: RuBisCO large subunit C-terminal-like domain-containing protein [Thermoanaerobaculia bacterium]